MRSAGPSSGACRSTTKKAYAVLQWLGQAILVYGRDSDSKWPGAQNFGFLVHSCVTILLTVNQQPGLRVKETEGRNQPIISAKDLFAMEVTCCPCNWIPCINCTFEAFPILQRLPDPDLNTLNTHRIGNIRRDVFMFFTGSAGMFLQVSFCILG